MHVGGDVVCVSYDIPELHFRIGVAFNAIYKMHQQSRTLKNNIIVKRMTTKG
jgi:hypothetical protein